MNSQIRSNALGLALRSAVLRSHGGRAGRRMDLWQVRRGHHVLHPHFVVVASHRLVQGVPKAWPAVGPFLTDRVGFGFPILSKLTHQGPVQAIAGVLADNVDASVSVTGLEVEVAAAIVFCTQELGSRHLVKTITWQRLLWGWWNIHSCGWRHRPVLCRPTCSTRATCLK
ncbi:hypothetical protein, variant 3 [Aphanomyces astaci]|uniref:Uncharacterized protein n=1 Tax=Aphanomyces astaci TaxID=112090 RepID=W4G0D3_APHAT|nr:hypothetical protein, variant 2 [Aphanomyces astaci]XP_009837345.1 hypothetical protein, variant 3 [Aphanomyces astaci]ETV73139.1 hypothetical protein, variant 2 [Aphanomyces astaci]ETV73140.1 hypothetical protein, variant 3 [Aphanomyces astaci]|eukprot:XP_009837344.1 hypothetical protein, variant 2 [Aphanomyces astaci]